MSVSEKEYGSSIYAKQLAEGFKYPRFQDALEREYRTTYNAQNSGRIKISLIVTALIVIAASVVDFISFPEGYRVAAVAITLGGMLPALLIAYWAAGQPGLISSLHWYLFGAALMIGIGITLISIIVPAHHYAVSAMLLAIIFAYFVSGLLLHLAVIAGLGSVVLYMSVNLSIEGGVRALQNGFVLISANLLGMVGCYSLECMNRAAFLRASAAQDLAGVDELTGMPNRRRFMNHSQALWNQAIRDGATVGIMLIDVDYFKRYNDAVGHLAGDKCLRRIGDALLHAPKRSLDMVARFGGEEFIAIWFPGIPEAIPDVVQRMHERVNAIGVLHPDSDISKFVTTSVGVSTVQPGRGLELKDAIRLADKALYQAKERGRDRIVYVNARQPEDFMEIIRESKPGKLKMA